MLTMMFLVFMYRELIPAGGNYNEQNIALIPGTTTLVLINTVNDGFSDALFPPPGITCDLTNTAFYDGVIPGVVYSET